jgi:hypothetical protein
MVARGTSAYPTPSLYQQLLSGAIGFEIEGLDDFVSH